MGVDLNLFVLYHSPREGEKLAGVRSQLRVERDYGVFEQMEKAPFDPPENGPSVHVFGLPVGASISYCSEEGLEGLTEDAYGEPLTYTYAGELRRLEWPEDDSRWNWAVKAFLEALPGETAIVLYWC